MSDALRDQIGISEDWSGFLTTLFGSRWSRYHYDAQLYAALAMGLKQVRFLELYAHFVERDVTLNVRDPSLKAKPIVNAQKIVTEAIEGWFKGHHSAFGPPYYRHGLENDTTGWVACVIPYRPQTLSHSEPESQKDGVMNVMIGVYRRSKDWDIATHTEDHLGTYAPEARFVHGLGTSILGVIAELLRQRMQLFSAFPNKISTRYWDDAIQTRRSHISNGSKPPKARRITVPTHQSDQLGAMMPPWDHRHAVRGVTLSLDLRRSTFCMEQANSAEEFAEWLRLLVQILTRVAHDHGGIFDKFTGDGCIVHFLEKEQQVLYDITAVEAAVECAFDMHEASAFMMGRLRKFLRFDSAQLGAGIGIDFGECNWSLDHQNSPVVVGRAVVGACRMCGVASAGMTSLTNVAYHQLSVSTRELFENVTISTKDFASEMAIQGWINREAPRSGSRMSRVLELCETIEQNGYGSF